MHECECVSAKRIITRLPGKMRKARMTDIDDDLRGAVLDWLAKPNDGLLITGDAGRGKTYLAAAIVRMLILIRNHFKPPREVYFIRCPEFYLLIRECFDLRISERHVYEQLTSPYWLALDDMGAGALSDFQRSATLELLDQRLNKNYPTIVTTNWSLGEITAKMDERIASRLGAFTALELAGKDRRLA